MREVVLKKKSEEALWLMNSPGASPLKFQKGFKTRLRLQRRGRRFRLVAFLRRAGLKIAVGLARFGNVDGAAGNVFFNRAGGAVTHHV